MVLQLITLNLVMLKDCLHLRKVIMKFFKRIINIIKWMDICFRLAVQATQ